MTIVQVYNPAKKKWVKLDTQTNRVISMKSTPYKNLRRYGEPTQKQDGMSRM